MKLGEYLEIEQKQHIKKLYARIEDNFHLANKKGLLLNMQEYYRLKGKCIFKSHVFPQTFLIKNGYSDEEYYRLKEYIMDNPESVWIVKPGENSNRGTGIQMCSDLTDIDKLIEEIQTLNEM
jgi:hypothetical protein